VESFLHTAKKPEGGNTTKSVRVMRSRGGAENGAVIVCRRYRQLLMARRKTREDRSGSKQKRRIRLH